MRKLLAALLFIACGLNVFVDYLGSPAFGQGLQQQLPVPLPPSFGGIGSTSIKYYGAKGDGSANDTAAFTAAFAAGGYISVPCGTYNVTTTTITQSNTKLIAQGIAGYVASGCVTIQSTVANQPVILVAASLTGIEISGMTIDRTVTATAGGTGIDYHNTGDQSAISNVVVQNQWDGIWLGPTGIATLKNSRSWKNYNTGILMDDTWGAGGAQWWLDTITLQQNNSHDIEVHAINGTVTVGTWTNIITFGSTGSCVYAHADSGQSIDSIRMIGGFLGSNNAHCIRLATRGGNHVFDSVHMELMGNIATGRTSQTAASNTGDCYNIDSTNALVTISNPYCNQPWGNGVTTSATLTQVNGGTFQNARGTQGGVYSAVAGAKLIATGINSGNNGGVLQQNGIFAADGKDVSVVGARLLANAVAPYGATTNANYISNCGVLNSAWNAYTPTVTTTGTAFTAASATGLFKKCGNTVAWQAIVTITTVGAASGRPTVTLPTTTQSASIGIGSDSLSQNTILAIVLASATTASFALTNGNSPMSVYTNGDVLTLNGTYESQ